MSWSILVFLSTLSLTTCSARFWHPSSLRAKRQELCSDRINKEICTNGLQEEYAYLADQCNQPDVAQFIRDVCRSNENAVLCGTIDTYDDTQQVSRACNLSLAPDSSECADECRSLLASIRAEYGCCMTIINSTTPSNFIQDDDVAFGYPLWSRCGVETVREECPPSPFAAPEEADPTCTSDGEFQRRFTENVLCRTEYLNGLRDLVISCSGSTEDIDSPSQCAIDENGDYCQDGDVFSVEFTASQSCRDTSVCDPLCVEALRNFTSAFGCCFVTLLNSTSGGEETQREWLSYEFWQRCGLTSPGFCEIRLNDSPSPFGMGGKSGALFLEVPVFVSLLTMALSVIQ